jgi:HAE1 family hydrophobic/amphiphilic exporter-1
MQWLANISVRRAVFASVLMLAVVVVGLASYGSLGVDRFPDVDFPTVAITTVLPGASPEEIETEISDKIEESVNTVSGIDELRSISAEGLSVVYVNFVLDKNVDVAAQEVRDAVNRALPKLPSGIDQPVVAKMDPDASPILYLAMDSAAPLKESSEVADKLVRRRLESINGVGEVKLVGAQPRQMNVWLDPARLKSMGLTAGEVKGALLMQNLTIPGGSMDAGSDKVTVRVAGRAASREQLESIVVRERGDSPVRLADVARVEDGVKDAESMALLDGKPAIVLSVRKQSGTNTIAVVDAVKDRVQDIQKVLPSGYSLRVVRDNSGTIRTSVDAVKEHLILGAIFAAIIVLIFLGSVRSTLIAAIAIPVSIIGTFGLMAYQGFTLNTITMLALALAVGIVIDDAIVVLEVIHRYINEKHIKPFPAAILATREIGLAVLATTMSLLAVFLPVAFMTGIVGRFLNSFGLTMASAIAVSLLVAFSLTPMLAARWLRPHPEGKEEKKPVLEQMVERFYKPIEHNYGRLLSWVMHHRWVVVTASVVTFLSVIPLGAIVPKGFLPKSDEAQFLVEVRAPEGTRFEETALKAERIARQVRELPDVQFTMVTVGDSVQRLDNLANIYVRLNDPTERKQSVFDIMATVRDQVLPKQPKDLQLSVMEPPMFEGGWKNKAIMYEITGTDLKELERISHQAVEEFKKVPGAVDVDSDLFSGKPELVLRIDRNKAADLGVRVSDVASALRILIGGEDVTEYREGGEVYDVHLRADRSFRADRAGLELMTVPSTKLGSVRLTDVVQIADDTGPTVINRNGRKRQVMFTASALTGASEAAIGQAFEKIMQEKIKLPPGYKFQPAGRSKEMGKMFKAFMVAVVLSFVFMYLVLAAQFESWLHPITILMALPLTLPFAMISLILLRQQLDIYSMLGILVLFGMVKKNSILQVDHTNQLRAKGLGREAAILQANKDRLRPILMTTFAFVAGMLPLAFSKGIGAGFNQATAGVIVGGQVLSLLLTLVATPVTYSILDDWSVALRRMFSRGSRPSDDELGIHDLDERKLKQIAGETLESVKAA